MIQKELVDPIARKLLAGEIEDGSVIAVSAGEDGLAIGKARVHYNCLRHPPGKPRLRGADRGPQRRAKATCPAAPPPGRFSSRRRAPLGPPVSLRSPEDDERKKRG